MHSSLNILLAQSSLHNPYTDLTQSTQCVAVTKEFKSNVQVYCLSEYSLDMINSAFEHSMRKLGNFHDHRFDVNQDEHDTNMDEQSSTLQQEYKQLQQEMEQKQQEMEQKQQEMEQLHASITQCIQLTASMATALPSGFICPPDVLHLQDKPDMSNLKHNLQVVLSSLQKIRSQKSDCECQTEEMVDEPLTQSIKKLQSLMQNIDNLKTRAAKHDTMCSSRLKTGKISLTQDHNSLTSHVSWFSNFIYNSYYLIFI